MLPFPMPSMDKIKPSTKALDKWITKYSKPSSYEVSAKLDGTSGLYTTIHGVGKLYTRGDGLIGKDISHLIPFLRLPDAKKHAGLVIRGEFVISKENFKKYFKSKGSKNARNTVAGLTNTLVGSADHAYMDYVGYEVMQPELTPAKQMEMMEKTMAMITVKHKTVSGLTTELLSDLLVDWRQNYTYEIDGIIVAHNKIYKERKNKNPEYAFAFKMVLSDQVAEAKVVNILWTPSKDGYLKPRVQIEPIELGGVTIEYATGFNAEFIEKHKLGVGSVVELVRSGDVIPHIQKVIRGAKEPLMPDVNYVWNDTHVDIMLVDKGADPVVREKNILGFFKTLDVEGVGPGVVKKMMNAGYSSVPAILWMKKDDFLGLDGFKEKMADKVYMHIQNGVEKATLPMLMKASNIFGRGFGEKKLKPVLKKYPTLLVDKESDAEKIAKLMTVEGWSTKSSTAFVKHIDTFIAFLKECGLYERFVAGVDDCGVGDGGVDVSHPLYGKKVVMTGFRDKELANLIESVGGEIGSSVSKKIFVVLVKNLNEDTGKAEQARQLGVSLMIPDGFKQMYLS
jgi:NAD-dependent DNA ligase